jgi:hypothetical protein
MKNLPTGIQTHAKIRFNFFVYFDKSPLVDTLKELLEGYQAFFKRFFIEDKWNWSKTEIHSVMVLSFSYVS